MANDARAQGLYTWDAGFDLDALVAASAAHLADLRRANPKGPPADVAVRPTSVPRRAFAALGSLVSSPASLCAAEGGAGG